MLHEKVTDDWLLKFNFVSAIKVWQEHPGTPDAFKKAEYWIKTARDLGCSLELGVKKDVLESSRAGSPSIAKKDADDLGRQTHDRILFEISPANRRTEGERRVGLRLGKVQGQPYLVLESTQRPVGFFKPDEILSLQII